MQASQDNFVAWPLPKGQAHPGIRAVMQIDPPRPREEAIPRIPDVEMCFIYRGDHRQLFLTEADKEEIVAKSATDPFKQSQALARAKMLRDIVELGLADHAGGLHFFFEWAQVLSNQQMSRLMPLKNAPKSLEAALANGHVDCLYFDVTPPNMEQDKIHLPPLYIEYRKIHQVLNGQRDVLVLRRTMVNQYQSPYGSDKGRIFRSQILMDSATIGVLCYYLPPKEDYDTERSPRKDRGLIVMIHAELVRRGMKLRLDRTYDSLPAVIQAYAQG